MSGFGKKRSLKEISDEERDLLAIDAVTLTGVVRSKKDLYDFLTLKLQKHLPPYKECTIGTYESEYQPLTTA